MPSAMLVFGLCSGLFSILSEQKILLQHYLGLCSGCPRIYQDANYHYNMFLVFAAVISMIYQGRSYRCRFLLVFAAIIAANFLVRQIYPHPYYWRTLIFNKVLNMPCLPLEGSLSSILLFGCLLKELGCLPRTCSRSIGF